jgi:hypothetical protein
METKLFELRDVGTFIPLLCVKPEAERPHASDCKLHQDQTDDCSCGVAFENKMAWRYGYRDSGSVIVTHMSVPDRGCQNDPHAWGDRTFQVAHDYIRKHWDELKSGALIDVRFILGESITPCESEA